MQVSQVIVCLLGLNGFQHYAMVIDQKTFLTAMKLVCFIELLQLEVWLLKETLAVALRKQKTELQFCWRKAGEKLKPLIIGKSKQPMCFKNIKPDKLGVDYEANPHSWMTGEIFREWLQTLNNKMALQQRKILLLLDNCAAHPHTCLSNVTLLYLPPNTTAKLQPMDAGIIQHMKLNYRKRLLQHVLNVMDDASCQEVTFRQVSLKLSLNLHTRLDQFTGCYILVEAVLERYSPADYCEVLQPMRNIQLSCSTRHP